jgi:hypothetical protein
LFPAGRVECDLPTDAPIQTGVTRLLGLPAPVLSPTSLNSSRNSAPLQELVSFRRNS